MCLSLVVLITAAASLQVGLKCFGLYCSSCWILTPPTSAQLWEISMESGVKVTSKLLWLFQMELHPKRLETSRIQDYVWKWLKSNSKKSYTGQFWVLTFIPKSLAWTLDQREQGLIHTASCASPWTKETLVMGESESKCMSCFLHTLPNTKTII